MVAMLQVVEAVAAGQLPRDTGIAMLEMAFQIPPRSAEAIMGTVGAGFVPTVPEPKPGETDAGGEVTEGEEGGEA